MRGAHLNGLLPMNEISFNLCAVAFLDILGFKDFMAAAEIPDSKEFAQF
jgi:hypothetical protein